MMERTKNDVEAYARNCIMFKLKVIITSTRPGRKGPAIASWVMEETRKHPEFDPELLDLAVINLPFMDEPNHPMLLKYEHQHTRDWSRKIADADAFIFVTPEYNFGFTAPFKNAIDYLHHEWKSKPAGIVSYGGVSAGTRSAQMMKQVLTAVGIMPLYEAVSIPMFGQFLDKEGIFTPNEPLKKGSDAMFAALARWTKSLQEMRANDK